MYYTYCCYKLGAVIQMRTEERQKGIGIGEEEGASLRGRRPVREGLHVGTFYHHETWSVPLIMVCFPLYLKYILGTVSLCIASLRRWS